MSDINVNAMDRAELERTANDLDVKFAHNASDETLRNKLREALGEPAMPTLEPELPPSHPASETETKQAAPAKEKRFEIIIQTDGKDKQPVPVGVNGKMWAIQRGKNVVVPQSVIEVLRNAVRYEYDPKDMSRTEVLAYPFQIVREVE